MVRFKDPELMNRTEKKCGRCFKVKSLDNFSKCSGCVDGLQSYCRKCKQEIGLKYRGGKVTDDTEINDVETDNIPTDFETYSKRCSYCREVKSLDYFYKNKTSSDGYSSRCTLCYKHSYIRNRDVANAQALKRYYEKHDKELPSSVAALAENKVKFTKETNHLEKSEYQTKREAYQQEAKAKWRAIFDERRADVDQLLNDYIENPADSVAILQRFHQVVRPKWKLSYGRQTALYEELVKQGRYSTG